MILYCSGLVVYNITFKIVYTNIRKYQTVWYVHKNWICLLSKQCLLVKKFTGRKFKHSNNLNSYTISWTYWPYEFYLKERLLHFFKFIVFFQNTLENLNLN